jgi:hypothetical protein
MENNKENPDLGESLTDRHSSIVKIENFRVANCSRLNAVHAHNVKNFYASMSAEITNYFLPISDHSKKIRSESPIPLPNN